MMGAIQDLSMETGEMQVVISALRSVREDSGSSGNAQAALCR